MSFLLYVNVSRILSWPPKFDVTDSLGCPPRGVAYHSRSILETASRFLVGNRGNREAEVILTAFSSLLLSKFLLSLLFSFVLLVLYSFIRHFVL